MFTSFGRRLVAAIAVLAVCTLGFVQGAAAHATRPPYVPKAYFGMHAPNIGNGSYPASSAIGSIRLWDTGTSWRDIEKTRGQYDWIRLDTAVNTALAHHASVMLVLGGTPAFYAQKPDAPSIYGTGFCSPTNDLGAWKNYVRAVATRYKGRITAYEPHNEGDILSFWCGTPAQLLSESRLAYQTIKAVDPKAIVTSPSFVDRLTSSQYAIVGYLTQSNNAGCKWADAISYHPYGMPTGTPEQSKVLTASLRHKLDRKGCDKPIWSTEVNLGLAFGDVKPSAQAWSSTVQSAYIVREYLLQFAAGARRLYWYAWMSRVDASFLGITLVDTDGTPTPPATAFATVHQWMKGRFVGYSVAKNGGYTFTMKYKDGGYGIIKWQPKPNAIDKFAIPKHTIAQYNMYGQRMTIHRHLPQYVGMAPVLYRTSS